jgi:hypothetical protein
MPAETQHRHSQGRTIVRTCAWTVLLVLSASIGYAQSNSDETGVRPDFRVSVVGYLSEDFHIRVWRYLEFRRALEEGLPPLIVTSDPADIGRAERALATRLRIARPPQQGQLFTPAISLEFRRVLLREMTTEAMRAIMDENPGSFSHGINGAYPKEQTFSTVPPTILAVLPELPDDIQYRFLGRHLVLHDTRANVILDRIPCALACTR